MKHCGFLRKKPDDTVEQFRAHWLGVHTELAKRLPGLREYRINSIDREANPESPFDGFSELWFDSREAHDAAFATPDGVALVEDVSNFIGDHFIAFVEEHRMR